MLRSLKKLFTDDCPECNQSLEYTSNHLYYTKSCPNGHFSEETYPHLGVSIVYKN
jgi:hypothetical protein